MSTRCRLARQRAANQARQRRCAEPNPSASVLARRKKALCKRQLLAQRLGDDLVRDQPTNGDDSLPERWASFFKTLPQDNIGLVDEQAYGRLLVAVNTGLPQAFADVPLALENERGLANPQAAFAFAAAGGDPQQFRMLPPPRAASAQTAAEMVEVYANAELRDVPFDEYATNASALQVIVDLNELASFYAPKVDGKVTPQTLFRGESVGDLAGNYVSQFLLLPVENGAQTREQRYRSRAPGTEYLTDQATLVDVQRGRKASDDAFTDERYIYNGRGLAEFVHSDSPIQPYYQASQILLAMGAPPNVGSPYASRITNQDPFVTFGVADYHALLGAVSSVALKTAWAQKWVQHRRLRPEVFGLRAETNRQGVTAFPLDAQFAANPIVQRLVALNGNSLLPAAYPEGSPTHPAYPAGHAVVAGALITVLKAFFDEAYELPDPVQVVPGSDGDALEPYVGAPLALGDELNKLGNNISIGRCHAGVHYRSDGTEGVLLGEQVAIRFLRDWSSLYNEPLRDWSVRSVTGRRLYIFGGPQRY